MHSLIEPVEPRILLAGVTILTHGYQGDVKGWVATMADDIALRAGGASSVATYTLSVTADSNRNLSVSSYTRQSGSPAATSLSTGEIIVKLDWSTVSGGVYSTGEVASVVANFMMSANADGVRLAQLPITLIGHSRGASLDTALAQDLGKAGVWVDQQTNLDPHPVDGVNDLLNLDFGDQKMATFDNVAFSDTYWRTDGNTQNFDFDGEPVSGSHNLDLIGVQAHFVGGAHSSVPSYYDGTINLTATNGGDTPIFSDWYGTTPDKPARDQTGFFYDHIVAGPRPADGLWASSSGTASRTAAGQSGSQWAEVTDLRVMSTRTVKSGVGITLRFIRQDRDGSHHVDIFLDKDTNPFNNNFARTMLKQNMRPATTITATRVRGATGGTAPGRYWICARMTDNSGHTRYAYSLPVTITAPAGAAPSDAPSTAPAMAFAENPHVFSDIALNRDPLESLS